MREVTLSDTIAARNRELHSLRRESVDIAAALRSRLRQALERLHGLLATGVHPDSGVERALRVRAELEGLSYVSIFHHDEDLAEDFTIALHVAHLAQLAAAQRQAFAELR
jgi:plasmid stabilization system protein ParE